MAKFRKKPVVIEAVRLFSALGGRIAIGDIPRWLERGWIEIETTWESFGEREPWQDDDEVVVVDRSRARMRIYRHAVVTASVIYAEEPAP